MKNIHKIYWGACIGTIVIVIGAYAIFGDKSGDFSSWSLVGDADAGFVISFPSVPDHQSHDIPIPESEGVILQDSYTLIGSDKMRYVFVRSLQPTSLVEENPVAVLQSALQGMIQTSPSNTLQSSDAIELSGRPALRFSIADTSENTVFEGIITYKDQSVYQAFISYDEGKKNEANTDYFLASLKIQ